MIAPERIWTASTNGKCHVGFDAPSLNYTNEYVRADLAAVQPMQVQLDPRDDVIARMVDALSMAQLWLDYAGAYDMQGINAALAAAKAVQHG